MNRILVETERLYISTKSMEEMKAVYNTESDPEMKKAYSEMLDAMRELNGREEWGSGWNICLKTGVRIGGICFKGAPDTEETVEIGYGIDEAYRRKGYATEAIGAIVKWAMVQDGVQCVTAQTEPNNMISQKVLFRNGFLHEGYGEEGPLYKVER